MSDTTTLDLVLELEVLLVNTALLGQKLIDLSFAHLLLVFEILDTGRSDRNVNVDEVCHLAALHSLSLGLLSELRVVQLACLDILDPAVTKDSIVELVNSFMKISTDNLEVFLLLILLALLELGLLNSTIRDSIIALQSGKSLQGIFLLTVHDSLGMVLSVHSALQTIVNEREVSVEFINHDRVNLLT